MAPDPKVELFLIDEIGLLECASSQFRDMIVKIMNSKIPLISTLSSHDVLETLKIKKRNDLSILNMTYKNRDIIWRNVMVELSKPGP